MSTNSISFSIPGKPGAKARPRASARIVNNQAIVTVHSDKDMIAREKEIARLYKIAAQGHQTQSGPVMVKIIAVFDVPESWPRATQQLARQGKVWHVGRPDGDNIAKLAIDALNGIAWADDGQVAMTQIAKRYGYPARTEVTITPLEQPPEAVTPGQKRLEKRVTKEGWDQVLAKPERKKRADPADALPSRMSLAEFKRFKGKSRMPK